MKRGQSGYSLVELLVVIAIVGIVTLAGVPQFLKFSRSGAVRAASNQFVSDIRQVRQKAVEQTGLARLTFTTGVGATTYSAYLSTDNGGTWTELWTKSLPEGCYFESIVDYIHHSGDARPDIQFLPSGTAVRGGSVVIRSQYDLPRNRYTITMTLAGQLSTVGSHV
jgi:prepilin-type N-terminal cleavage/methylation domain-containing protein